MKNEDLDEYSKTNSLLLENIYAQVRYCVLCMITWWRGEALYIQAFQSC